jgi:hypothetical protein
VPIDLDLPTQLEAKLSFYLSIAEKGPCAHGLGSVHTAGSKFFYFVCCRKGTRSPWTWICPPSWQPRFLYFFYCRKGDPVLGTWICPHSWKQSFLIFVYFRKGTWCLGPGPVHTAVSQAFLIFVYCRKGTRCPWTWICPLSWKQISCILSIAEKGPGARGLGSVHSWKQSLFLSIAEKGPGAWDQDLSTQLKANFFLVYFRNGTRCPWTLICPHSWKQSLFLPIAEKGPGAWDQDLSTQLAAKLLMIDSNAGQLPHPDRYNIRDLT